MSLLTVSKIHPAVYYAALENEGWPLPADINEAQTLYIHEELRRKCTSGGLEKAICSALMGANQFAENGELSQYCMGYTHSR